MMQLDRNSPVGHWVAQRPETARVFEALQIDYCCGGGKSLEQACFSRRLEPETVVMQLRAAIDARNDATEENWSAARLSDLCNHIEQTHHAYLRTELPRLTAMAAKVVNAHGANHAELAEVQRVFAAFRAELEPHMDQEEQVLFPAIRLLEQSDTRPAFAFGTVASLTETMQHEHDSAGQALARIRQLTSDFRVPDGACNTYRAMLDGLHALERNMHLHVHKENNILFPRAAELEPGRIARSTERPQPAQYQT